MDFSWILSIKLFDIPLLRYLFHDHLPQTITILLILAGLVKAIISRLHNVFRNRKISIALKEKLFEATEAYIRPDYGHCNPGLCLEPIEVKEREYNLIDYLEKSFNKRSNHSRFIILGGAGMGKYALLYNVYNRYLKRYFRKYNMCLIELNIKGALDSIKKIENPDNTILLLDALDENPEALDDLPNAIKQISEHTQRFYRVVLTCRTQFFSRAEEVPNILANVGGVVSAGEYKKGTYEKLYLYPFTNSQIEFCLLYKYLFKIRNISPLNYFKARKTFKKVPNISVRPMLLTYIDFILKVNIELNYTFRIYESMIYGWLQRRKLDELDPSLGENLNFVYHLAIQMARKHKKNGGYFVSEEGAIKLAKK